MRLSLGLKAFDPSLGLAEIGLVGPGIRLGPAESSLSPRRSSIWVPMLEEQRGCPGMTLVLGTNGPKGKDSRRRLADTQGSSGFNQPATKSWVNLHPSIAFYPIAFFFCSSNTNHVFQVQLIIECIFVAKIFKTEKVSFHHPSSAPPPTAPTDDSPPVRVVPDICLDFTHICTQNILKQCSHRSWEE